MKTLNDLTAPVEVVRKVLETDLQGQCVDWARRNGWWARKFSSISQRSVPDYLFAKDLLVRESKHGNDWTQMKVYCEFKKPGTKSKLIEKYGVTVMSTEQQYEEQQAMRNAGWDGFECSDFEAFKAWMLKYERDVTPL